MQSYLIAGVTLHGPLTVQDADMYTDGGTLTLTLVDAEGTSLQVCNDGRVIVKDLATVRREPADSPRHFYVGGPHPTAPTARPLEIGGSDERELTRALKDWSDRYDRTGELRLSVSRVYRFVSEEELRQSQLRIARSFLEGLERRPPAN